MLEFQQTEPFGKNERRKIIIQPATKRGGFQMTENRLLYPWRLDSTDRYREVLRVIMGLSTGVLIVPVFFLRDVLNISNEQISQVLNPKIYISWGSLGLSITFGLIYFYASAKYIRLAWGQHAKLFGKDSNDYEDKEVGKKRIGKFVDNILRYSFWCAIFTFYLGVVLVLWFIVTNKPTS